MTDELKRRILAVVFGLLAVTEFGVWVYFHTVGFFRYNWKDVGMVLVAIGTLAAAIYVWHYQPPR